MAVLRIRCQRCYRHYDTRRKNTKLCADCRLMSNIQFIAGLRPKNRTHECVVCEKTFAPIGRYDAVCLNCDVNLNSLTGHGNCGICGAQDTTLYREGLAVCLNCATSPETRQKFIRGLTKKMADIAARNRDADAPERASSFVSVDEFNWQQNHEKETKYYNEHPDEVPVV